MGIHVQGLRDTRHVDLWHLWLECVTAPFSATEPPVRSGQAHSQTGGGPGLSKGPPDPRPLAHSWPLGKRWAFAPGSQHAQPKAGSSKARKHPLRNVFNIGSDLLKDALQMRSLLQAVGEEGLR